MKALIILLTVSALMCSAYSEVRMWETKDGQKYEAEFLRELFGKLTLKTTAGEEVRIPVEEFSEHDQKYLRVMVPPVMEVNFSKSTRIKSKQYDDQYDQDVDVVTILSASVDIKKASKRPFTSRLTSELFLIAQEAQDRDYYILLSKTESSFLLGDHNDNHHSFDTDPIELQVYTEYTQQRRGPEYIGYLVAISDARGNLVQVVTDIEWLRDKVPELRDLYMHGAASVYSRYFDKETVSKQKVPRPRDYSGRTL
jgi:nitrogen fixation-related uncharacterized protein